MRLLWWCLCLCSCGPGWGACAPFVSGVTGATSINAESVFLDEQAVIQFFRETALRQTILARVDRDEITDPFSYSDPKKYLARLFYYLSDREIKILTLRYGLSVGSEGKRTLAQFSELYGCSRKSAQRMESAALQSLALAMKLCGPEISWHPIQSIKQLGLSENTEHILMNNGIISISQLQEMPEIELATLRRFGVGRAAEVREALQRVK